MNLKAIVFHRIQKALSGIDPDLQQEDFIISDGNDEDGKFTLRVEYIYAPNYFFHFVFTVNSNGGYIGKVTRIPGLHLLEEAYDATATLDSVIEEIRMWGHTLAEELVAIPVRRRFEVHQSLLDSILDKYEDLPDEYFTKAEAEEMKARLERAEGLLRDLINVSSADSAVKERKLEQLHKEIEDLKTKLDVLRKPGFAKRFFSRLSGVIDEDTKQKLIGVSAEAMGKFAKGYLGSGNGDKPPE